ncbi:hypothetical protein CDAR_519611 [Caerostris darwini]|uniref:Ycf15 n=1 Tax=Caerostris darwini TaxID=1538125 RepID=A0AAV4TL20_9ARAC|nr:hypothetical protein CDAR_519611 [Caerostris darwini]
MECEITPMPVSSPTAPLPSTPDKKKGLGGSAALFKQPSTFFPFRYLRQNCKRRRLNLNYCHFWILIEGGGSGLARNSRHHHPLILFATRSAYGGDVTSQCEKLRTF